MKPCIVCGEPSSSSRCDEHQREQRREELSRRESASARGYDHAWNKLSKRARALQPWCSVCFTTEDLTADHLPSAWRRKAEGKAIRLRDVDVLCSEHNTLRGSSRPGSERAETWGESPSEGLPDRGGKPQSEMRMDLTSGESSS